MHIRNRAGSRSSGDYLGLVEAGARSNGRGERRAGAIEEGYGDSPAYRQEGYEDNEESGAFLGGSGV